MLRQSFAKTRIAACLSVCAALLAGCSTVPSSGPTRNAVLEMGSQSDAPFLLVPISDPVLDNLVHFPGPSLYGRFGDYRPPLVQRIGVGDTLEVTIYEAAPGGLFSQPVTSPETTGSHSVQLPPQVVQRDGTIAVPYAGRVPAAGKTTHEVEGVVVERLTGKAIEPQAVVTLKRNIATSVTVTGEAVKGARVPITARGDRLLDIIADAGGVVVPVNESFIELTRAGRTVRVPYQTLLAQPKENVFARPGDTLTVVRYPLSFTAVGATLRNAVVPYDAVGISLEEAIGKAAGFVDERADPEGVFVFRYEPQKVAHGYPGLTPAQAALNLVPTVYYINMRQARSLFLARRFSIHDKDVVYVSNSPFNDLQKLFGLVQAVTSPTISGIAIGSAFRSGGSANANTLGVVAATSAPIARAPVAAAAPVATP